MPTGAEGGRSQFSRGERKSGWCSRAGVSRRRHGRRQKPNEEVWRSTKETSQTANSRVSAFIKTSIICFPFYACKMMKSALPNPTLASAEIPKSVVGSESEARRDYSRNARFSALGSFFLLSSSSSLDLKRALLGEASLSLHLMP